MYKQHELESRVIDDLLVKQVVAAIMAHAGKTDAQFIHEFPLSGVEKGAVLQILRKHHGKFVDRVQISPTEDSKGLAATLIQIKKKGK